jgi:uncharacterized protein YebE (UPF0316 family)
METLAFTDSFLFAYILLPLIIFLARILDQTIGTIRIIFVSKGMKYLAPLLGFFEVLLWLIIMRQIFHNLDNYIYYIAYAGGFGMGNYVGIRIEEKMAMGVVLIRIIPQKANLSLIDFLKKAGYRFTSVKGFGSEGPVDIIMSIIKRKDVDDFVGIIKKFNPKAFFSIEEVKFVNEAYSDGQYYAYDFMRMRKMYKQIRKGK